MRKTLGYCLITVSCVAWLILPVIPFLSLSTAAKVSWAGGIFIFAEVTWWSAMPLLGKEMLEWGRQIWRWAQNLLDDDSVQRVTTQVDSSKDNLPSQTKNTEKHD